MVTQFMPLKLVTISNDEPQLGCPSRSEGTGLSNLEASAVGSVLIYPIVLTGKLPRFISDAGVEVVVVASSSPLKQFRVLKYIWNDMDTQAAS